MSEAAAATMDIFMKTDAGSLATNSSSASASDLDMPVNTLAQALASSTELRRHLTANAKQQDKVTKKSITNSLAQLLQPFSLAEANMTLARNAKLEGQAEVAVELFKKAADLAVENGFPILALKAGQECGGVEGEKITMKAMLAFETKEKQEGVLSPSAS